MTRRKWIVIAVVAGGLALLGAAGFLTHNTPAGQAPLSTITESSLGELRADFNRAAGQTRIILLLSPT